MSTTYRVCTCRLWVPQILQSIRSQIRSSIRYGGAQVQISKCVSQGEETDSRCWRIDRPARSCQRSVACRYGSRCSSVCHVVQQVRSSFDGLAPLRIVRTARDWSSDDSSRQSRGETIPVIWYDRDIVDSYDVSEPIFGYVRDGRLGCLPWGVNCEQESSEAEKKYSEDGVEACHCCVE